MRTLFSLLLIFSVVILFFSLTGHEVQSLMTTFLFGLVVGVLIGWWTGGLRTLWKLRNEDREKANTTYKQRKERHL